MSKNELDVCNSAGDHHARLIDESVPYHVISRVFQGRHLLRPEPKLKELILGVIGKAQTIYTQVELIAFAFMSNHFHAMARGPSEEFPCFFGYIKREISRRLGDDPEVNWPGTMWHEYMATALPTDESQVRCLKYILAQGTKEHLVERPQDWPGANSVHPLLDGSPLWGTWVDGTSYLRERQREARKNKPNFVRKKDFEKRYQVKLTPLPAWAQLNQEQRQANVASLVREICDEAREDRKKRKIRVTGTRRVLRVPRNRRTSLPHVPWFERRRRMICWADPRAPQTRTYLNHYWDFQTAFRAASKRSREDEAAEFPPRSFVATRHRAASRPS